jgi:hypothetical protein
MCSDIQAIVTLPSLDADYHFGEPKLYLSAHELARLTILRSKLGETRTQRESEALRRAPGQFKQATRA